MCIKSSGNSLCRNHPFKRHNIRVPRLNRWRRSRKGGNTNKVKTDHMERKNLKLYMENQSILKQNEALRNKALFLHQENLTLLTLLQNKFSNPKNHF